MFLCVRVIYSTPKSLTVMILDNKAKKFEVGDPPKNGCRKGKVVWALFNINWGMKSMCLQNAGLFLHI